MGEEAVDSELMGVNMHCINIGNFQRIKKLLKKKEI